MAKDRKNNKEKSNRNPFESLQRYWIYFLIFGLLILYFAYQGGGSVETNWKTFANQMYADGDVEKLEVINNEKVEVYIKVDSLSEKQFSEIKNKKAKGPHYFYTIGSAEVFHEQMSELEKKYPQIENVPISYTKESNWWGNILMWVIPFVLLFLLWRYMMGRALGRAGSSINSAYNFGQSQARISKKDTKVKVTFDDVAGLEEAKEEIYEMVMFLKNPEKYTRLGAKIPKGILLSGPPGTGKTLLAKAVAGEAGVPFLSLSGSEFIEMFVGVGASRMRDLFKKAKKMSPSIIFIDEIDTIGRSRGGAKAFQSNDERESTLNQLLAELDGFDTDSGVIVLAATNREDILDPALLRPGRFDRRVRLELPNLTEREAIFKVHMKPLKIGENIDAAFMAGQTPGFSGADIANICNEAALIAARRDKDNVERQEFLDAIDRVVGGLEKRTKIIKPEEKKRIAYHEAGHVTASWFLEHAHPVLKVTIIPRGRSLGGAWYLPEEHQIVTKSQMMDVMSTALGGRAAEDLFYNEVSSNALDDLEKVTKQAYNIVLYYGMSDEIKNISFYDSSGQSEQSLHKPYSEETAVIIDKEVRELVDAAYEKTLTILKEHKKELIKLAELLIEKEVVYKDEIREIMGPRPFEKNQNKVKGEES